MIWQSQATELWTVPCHFMLGQWGYVHMSHETDRKILARVIEAQEPPVLTSKVGAQATHNSGLRYIETVGLDDPAVRVLLGDPTEPLCHLHTH